MSQHSATDDFRAVLRTFSCSSLNFGKCNTLAQQYTLNFETALQ
jgi:hypothetical protein